MNYTLHQLQVFLKITETKSITRAAEELHLTQPAISIQLRNFQNQFHIPLTEIVGRKLYITEFGHEVALSAQRILSEVDNINYRTSTFRGLLAGRLKLSVVSSGKYVIPFYLSEFIKANKSIELEMDVTNKLKVLESLRTNEIDFALVSVLPKDMILENLSLLQNKLFLVGNKDVVLNGQTTEELVKEHPFIFREEGSATRMVMENFLASRRIPVGMKLQLTSNEAVKQAIIAGLGISIMPLIGIKNELENGQLKIIPMKGLPITTDWRLVWMKNKNFTPVAKSFLDFVQQRKEAIFEGHFSWIESSLPAGFH